METMCASATTCDGEAVSPVVAVRGRTRCRTKAPTMGLTIAPRSRVPTKDHDSTREVSVAPPTDQVAGRIIDDKVEALVPTQYLEGFIVAPVF